MQWTQGFPRLPACAVLLALAQPVGAQSLSPGDRVRVAAPQLFPRPQVGSLWWFDADSLSLQTKTRWWTVPRGQVVRLELSRDRHSYLVPGILAGAAVGLWAGIAYYRAQARYGCYADEWSGLCRPVWAVGGGVLFLSGVGAGAIIGRFSRTERWETLDPDKTQLARP